MKQLLPVFLLASAALAFPSLGRGQDVRTRSSTTEAASQPVKEIKGRVVTADGNPLVGATVRLLDRAGKTVSGTYTDANGNYSLTATDPGNQFVSVSFVNFETVNLPASGSQFSVTLKESEINLTEVVVTALGVERSKQSLSYSVSTVSGQELVNSGERNVSQTLAGKVAGVQVIQSAGVPGASSAIRIRGFGTFGSGNPLYVVDGVPINNFTVGNGVGGVANSNRAIDINPADIEDISVLKGAPATAQYGTAAINGVINIRTKRAKSEGVTVNYSGTLEISEVSQLPGIQQRWVQGYPSTADRAVTSVNGVVTGFTNPAVSTARPQATPRYLPPLLPNGKGGVQNSYGPEARSLGIPTYNNMENFFETAYSNTHNLSIENAGVRTSYRISIGVDQNTGVVPNSYWERFSTLLNGTHRISDRMSIGASLNLINSGGNRIQQGSNTSGVMLGLARMPINFDGSAGFQLPDGQQRTYFFSGAIGATGLKWDNPWWTVEKNRYEDDVNRVIATLNFDYDILPWLKFTYTPRLDQYNDTRRQFIEIGSATSQPGQILQRTIRVREIYSYAFLTANRKFLDDFNVVARVGNTLEDIRFWDNSVQGDGLNVLGLNTLGNASAIIAPTDAVGITRRASIIGDVSLDWKETVFLNATARNEWASTFGRDADASFLYPSVGAAFVFTKLEPLQDNSVISFGKLRASYGEVGSEPGQYLTQTYFNSGQGGFDGFITTLAFPFLGVNGFTLSNAAGNSRLRPERAKEYELGLEIGLFKNRIRLDATYYDKRTEDIIIGINQSAASGFTSRVDNAGSMRNWGWELTLNADVLGPNSKVRWTIDANWSNNQNEVTSLAPGVTNITLGGFAGNAGTSRITVGSPYGMLWGTTFQRNAQGQVLIANSGTDAGYPIQNPVLQPIFSPLPVYQMGIRNTVSFKGVTLSGLIEVRAGQRIWNGTMASMQNWGTHITTENRGELRVFDGVYADGTRNTTAVPLDYRYYSGIAQTTELAVQNAGWIRLRDVTLNYRWALDWGALKALDFTLLGRNLLLITDYEGVDPETSLTGAANGSSGLDFFNMPNTRSFALTISATFK